MTENWIIDVLTDLRTFARQNKLNALAEHLDDARLIAAAEIASKAKKTQGIVRDDADKARSLHRNIGASDIA